MKNRMNTFFAAISVTIMTTCVLAEAPYKAPDGRPVAVNKKGMPYCAIPHTCDIPEDCRNNEPRLSVGYIWTCQNKPGFCKGRCKKVLTKKA